MLVEWKMVDNVGIVTLSDPGRHNAFSESLVLDFHKILDSSQDARALIITGKGSSFCAGADIEMLLSGKWMRAEAPTSPVELFSRLESEERLTIAAVNGACLGGGLELMLSCDLAVAAESAFFGAPETKYGVIANTGLAKLSQTVGRRRTLDLALTRRKVTTSEAAAWGLVQTVVSDDELLESAMQLAHTVVDGASPGAIRVTKASVNRHVATDWGEVRHSLERLPIPEWEEGLRSFVEKRDANFERFWQ